MREILFRAKQVNNGEWVEGYFAIGKWYLDEKERYAILPIDLCFYPHCEINEWIEIDPETVCQYTGMVDKNGNRIWENDIISINTYDYMEPQEDFFGRVVYLEKWACWCIQPPEEEKFIPLCECEGSYQTDRFVEGNIFDNPELWKQETEDSIE